MPKIIIKGKGLVKAQFLNSQVNTPGPIGSGVYAPGFGPNATTSTTTQGPVPYASAVNNPDNIGNVDPFSSNFSARDWAKQLYTKTPEPKERKPSFMNKLGAWGQRTQQNLGKFYGALDDINSVLGQIDADKKYQAGQKAMRQNLLPDNTYAVGQQSDADTEGDYNINTGMLGKQGSYTVNKGQAINNTNFLPERVFYNQNQAKDGGETNPMRIRITRTPDQDIMAYGGQARHSLDLRRDALLTPNIKYEDDYEVNDTLKPVPREDANIEAEKDETAFGDFDGDGNFEHMKIAGKRHTEGGTPLNLPEGTFIFSDTAKMRIKDEEVLSYFSLKPKKGGYTPAEIAKRYDVNRYKALIENPEADDISKSTAEQMIKNYNKKLAYLALIQESMKGFPQGIPEVCNKILGIQDNTEEQTSQASPEDEEGMSAEMMQQPQQGMARYGTELRKYQGSSGGSTVIESDPNYQFKATSPGYIDYSSPSYAGGIWAGDRYKNEWIPTVKTSFGDPTRAAQIMQNLENYSGPDAADVKATVARAKKSRNPYAKLQELATDNKVGPFHRAILMSMQTTTSTTPPPPPPPSSTTTTTTAPPPPPIPLVPGETPREVNEGPLRPDVESLFAATAYPPKNYQIAVKSPPPTSERVFLKDPRQALAENQSLFNAASANIGAMGDVRTSNSLMSNLQGEALKGAAGIIGNVQDQNIDIFNQWSARNRAYQDQYNKEAADLATQRGFVARDTDVFNRNQGRLFERNRAAVKANMWNNMMKNNLLNATNPNYKVNPWTAGVAFKEGYDPNNFKARGSQHNYPSPEHLKELNAAYPGANITPEKYLTMANAFKRSQQDADAYAPYYNFYNPMVGGQ